MRRWSDTLDLCKHKESALPCCCKTLRNLTGWEKKLITCRFGHFENKSSNWIVICQNGKWDVLYPILALEVVLYVENIRFCITFKLFRMKCKFFHFQQFCGSFSISEKFFHSIMKKPPKSLCRRTEYVVSAIHVYIRIGCIGMQKLRKFYKK